MTFNRSLFSSATDHWSTPVDVLKSLDDEFHFDFDPCPIWGGVESNGLLIEWGKINFVNPPYSDIKSWMKKGWEEYQKGKIVVFLIPSRTDTKWWHEYCMKGKIRFIKGRLKFGDAKNSAPFPSCIVIFD